MTSAQQTRLTGDLQRVLDGIGVPPRSSAGPLLLVTVGLPGAGKSTFARRLARDIDAVVLESDALRARLFDAPTHAPAESSRLFAAINEAAAALLARGAAVIIDATHLTASDRAAALQATLGRAPSMLVYVTAPEDVIRARLVARVTAPRPDDHSSADVGVYEAMAPRLEPPAGGWQIDTSDAEASEATYWRIVAACRDARRIGAEGWEKQVER